MTNEPNEKPTVRERAIEWLVTQGVSTVLLAGLLFVAWHRGPQIAAKFQEGYEVNAQQLNRELTRILDSHDRDRASFERAVEKIAK